ncbi:MAG: hypothetical protein KGS45_02225 [Planctomycetes bacterium]|nr:hypothetical protein [Planctomycetota bacterium]
MSPRTVMYMAIGSIVLSLGVVLVIYWLARRIHHAAPQSREASWFRRVRASPYAILFSAVVIPVLFLAGTALVGGLISGGSLLVRVLDNLPMAGVFVALPLISRAKVATGGLLCAKCKYNVESLSPPTPEGQAKPAVHDMVCPECGSQFGWPGGTISEYHEWRKSRMVWPAIFLLPLLIQFGSIPFAGVLWWKSALLRLVPTSSLIEDVTTSRSFTMAVWDEIGKREISADECREISVALLSPPPRQYFSPDERRWLSASIAAGSVPAELVEPWLSRLVLVNTLLTPQSRDVAIKFDTAVLAPVEGTHVSLVVESDAPDQVRAPVIVPLLGTPAFSTHKLAPVPVGVKRAWVLAVLHAPGETVITTDPRDMPQKHPKALYVVRVPIPGIAGPAGESQQNELQSSSPGVPINVPQPNR